MTRSRTLDPDGDSPEVVARTRDDSERRVRALFDGLAR
jgi:hypothetical protein